MIDTDIDWTQTNRAAAPGRLLISPTDVVPLKELYHYRHFYSIKTREWTVLNYTAARFIYTTSGSD